MKLYVTALVDGRNALLIRPQSEEDHGIWDVPHLVDVNKSKIKDYTLLQLANMMDDIGINAVIERFEYDEKNEILNLRITNYRISEFYWWLVPDMVGKKNYSMAVKAWLWDQVNPEE